MNLAKGVDARTAASFEGMFCIGITIGRGINGFIAMKLKDRQMIRMGQAIILTGIIIMILPFEVLFCISMCQTPELKAWGGHVESQEIGLPVKNTGLVLPCGASGRWQRV